VDGFLDDHRFLVGKAASGKGERNGPVTPPKLTQVNGKKGGKLRRDAKAYVDREVRLPEGNGFRPRGLRGGGGGAKHSTIHPTKEIKKGRTRGRRMAQAVVEDPYPREQKGCRERPPWSNWVAVKKKRATPLSHKYLERGGEKKRVTRLLAKRWASAFQEGENSRPISGH